jgi:hypothetical protein
MRRFAAIDQQWVDKPVWQWYNRPARRFQGKAAAGLRDFGVAGG